MMELLSNQEARGIFHVGASESISRYNLNVKLAERMGYARTLFWPDRACPRTCATRFGSFLTNG